MEVLEFCRTYLRTCSSMAIRPSQLMLMNILCTKPGPHTPMMLADDMGVSRPMIAAQLAALVDAGYVSRISSPEDGRSVYVLPTKKGRLLIEKTNRNLAGVNAKLAAKMGDKKFQNFLKLIDWANEILAQ